MKIERRLRYTSVYALMAMVLALAITLAGCGQSSGEPGAMPPAVVSTIQATPTTVTQSDELPGRVAALRTAEIRPQVSGIVQRRLFEQGAEIQAGQPLFQIDPAPFKADADVAAAAAQRAEAALTRAQSQAARLEPLVQADAVSRQVYDDAVSQRDQAAADLAQARATLARRKLDLQYATVDAPISGRIDQAMITEGALVALTDSAPMARIQQLHQVYVDVRQPASSLEFLRDALSAQPAGGLPVAILRSNGEPYDVSGRILFSGVNVEAGTGDVLLRILVDNPRRALLPGMFVRARVPRVSYTDALMVPQQAVVRSGGQSQVWVLDAQNRAHATPVQLGELVDRSYRIRSGLSAGQQIVVVGLDRLADGAEVAPQPWVAPEPTAQTAAR